MIDLTFHSLFVLYLSLTLGSVLGIWLYHYYRVRKQIVIPTERSLYQCEYCHFAYVEENQKELNRCPQCQLLNKHNSY